MADSDAVRQMRRRRHRMGDHGMCTWRCKRARTSDSEADFDRSAALVELAEGLMAAWRADPGNAMLAREVRATLLALPSAADEAEDEFALMLRELSTPVRTDPGP
jgi:hypothetical protein